MQYIKNNLINSDDKIQVNVKPWGYDKMYMDKDLIEDISTISISRSI